MPALKIEDFASERFKVLVHHVGYTVFKRCNETESEIFMEGYAELKRLFRESRAKFDTHCEGLKYGQLL